VSCCTWNVNGGLRSKNIKKELGENLLSDWLLGRIDRRKAIFAFPADAEGDLGLEMDDVVTGQV